MKKIFVIDDDDSFHFLCERVFKRSGEEIEMSSAYDGVEALEILKSGTYQPDLILLDINMPRMNGHEFLAAYQSLDFGPIPIVAMLTSSDQDLDREKASKFSFVRDFMVKPLRKENITKLKTLFVETKATDSSSAEQIEDDAE